MSKAQTDLDRNSFVESRNFNFFLILDTSTHYCRRARKRQTSANYKNQYIKGQHMVVLNKTLRKREKKVCLLVEKGISFSNKCIPHAVFLNCQSR